MPTASTSKNNPFPVMEHMTVKLVREYLEKKNSIIVPIGVIEQHGYHLPLKTDAMIALMPVWKCGADSTGWSKAIREHDWHAGWLETSLIMALAPDLVRMDDMQTDPEPLLSQQIEHPDNYQHAEKIVDDPMVVPRQGQRPEIKVGVMGHPKSASATLGRKIIEDIVRDAANKIMEIDAKADGVYKEVAFTPEPILLI